MWCALTGQAVGTAVIREVDGVVLMTVDNDIALPHGWVWTTLGSIATYVNGKAFKPTDWQDFGRPIIRIQNLTGSTSKINRYPHEVEEKYIVEDGDLLISWSATLGAFIYRGEEAVLNQHIFKVIPNIDKKFLYYLVTAHLNSIKSQVHGSGMQHITKDKFDSTKVPLPDVMDQLCIVAKIEELFSQLDAAETALKRAKANLKRYRQSVLQAAVTGELTREWRAAHAGEIEPAGALLERIRAERRAKWEAELRAKGKDPAKEKYVEPQGPDTKDLPELPEGWLWEKIGSIFDVTLGGTPRRNKPQYWNGTIPWVSSGEVVYQTIRTTKEFITLEGLNNSNAKLLPVGTILMGMIGEGKTRGQVAILGVEACTNQNIASINCSTTPIIPEWLYYWLMSQYENIRKTSSGGMQYALNSERVKNLLFALPPLDEQIELVNLVDYQLSVIDCIDLQISSNLNKIETIRKSILQRAFSGQLLPQDTQL